MRRYPVGALFGMLVGMFVLHPFSMVFQELVHPGIGLDFSRIGDAFNPHHLPMAVFFGILGAAAGALNVAYTFRIMKGRERIRALEGLLPICAYCKKIRDDEGKEKGEGEWVEVDRYIARKTDTSFTHGMCPGCYEDMMAEIDREEDEAGNPATHR